MASAASFPGGTSTTAPSSAVSTATASAYGASAGWMKPERFLPACSGSILRTTRACDLSSAASKRERPGMNRESKDTATACANMESRAAFPHLHIAAATEDSYNGKNE